MEHFISALAFVVGSGCESVDEVYGCADREGPILERKFCGVQECTCHVLNDFDGRLGMRILLAGSGNSSFVVDQGLEERANYLF